MEFIEYPLGDGIGFIEFVESMGNDAFVCRAARVSSGRESRGDASDARLINYLMANRHTTPFEMCELIVHVKAPVFVERQWFRHRTASINSASMRYKQMPDEAWVPRPGELGGVGKKNKQVGDGALDSTVAYSAASSIMAQTIQSRRAYDAMVEAGVATEDARIVLPLNQYTEWYWKCDLHNALHFLELRLHPHAQREIRLYAAALARLVRDLWPVTWAAFEEHRLYAAKLSRTESFMLRGAAVDDRLIPIKAVDIITAYVAQCREIAALIGPATAD